MIWVWVWLGWIVMDLSFFIFFILFTGMGAMVCFS